MDITPLIPKGRKIINAYGNGGFTINGEKISGSLIILPEQLLEWPIADFTALTSESFAKIMQRENIEILLIGAGANHKILDKNLQVFLKSQITSVDTMSTGAACRTYNVLLSEGRNVAAALIAV